MSTDSKNPTRFPIVALAFLFSTACTTGDAASTWTGTITDSAGIKIVQNPTEGMWAAGEGWTVEEVLSIGEITGEPEYEFGQIVSVDVDDAGNVYIADIQAQEVRVFDAGGGYSHTIGAPGAGPGEIGAGLTAVFALPDEVLIPDIGNRRINRYSHDGAVIGSDLIEITEGVPVRWDRIGDQVITQLRSVVVEEGGEPTGDVVVTVGETGTRRDTILSLAVGQSLQFVNGRQQQRVFEPEPIWDASSDGRIVMAVNDAMRVEVRDAQGTPVHIVTRPSEEKLVTERDRRVFLDAIRSAAEQQGAPAGAIEAYLTTVEFAEKYPAFVTITHGPASSLWAQRFRSGDEISEEGDFNPQDMGSTTWDVFDDEGRYLGDVRFPGKYQPIKVIGDRIFGIARDELDVQSMKVYRVVMD